jgi:hypothetical protein
LNGALPQESVIGEKRAAVTSDESAITGDEQRHERGQHVDE